MVKMNFINSNRNKMKKEKYINKNLMVKIKLK